MLELLNMLTWVRRLHCKHVTLQHLHQSVFMIIICFFCLSGVALLANAPERVPEKKKRGREKEAVIAESRHFPPASSSSKPSSRAPRQRVMAQREEQFAAHKVFVVACITSFIPLHNHIFQNMSIRGKPYSNCAAIII